MSNSENLPQRNYGRYAIAASILCLSASIGYFALQLSSLEKVAESVALYRDVAPELVHEVAQITEKIPLIINEVAAVREEVPAILAEIEAVRAEIPSVLAEVAAVRAEIPAILTEISVLRRETIPAVLVETKMLQTITLPAMLAESNTLRSDTVPGLIAESTALREETIPTVLTEIKTTREEMPRLLAQAGEIARSAGKNASEGAVSGIFSGIFNAPINLFTGVTDSVFKGKSLSTEDRRLIGTASSEVLKQDYLLAAETWGSAETGSAGDVTITAMAVNGDERCRELSVKGYNKKKSLGTTVVNVCHDSSGEWKIRE